MYVSLSLNMKFVIKDFITGIDPSQKTGEMMVGNSKNRLL